jgi:hypothetical protein
MLPEGGSNGADEDAWGCSCRPWTTNRCTSTTTSSASTSTTSYGCCTTTSISGFAFATTSGTAELADPWPCTSIIDHVPLAHDAALHYHDDDDNNDEHVGNDATTIDTANDGLWRA